jgi:hypothetical protein
MIRGEEELSKKRMFHMPDKCPSCESGDIGGDFFSGEVFCRRCGLVLE